MLCKHSCERGFTLLEILIALTIMAMLTAMVWPAWGILDDAEREKITLQRMEEIRVAILGPPHRADEGGNRIIGGFVGDMHRWPYLWEPRTQLRSSYGGAAWDNPSSMPAGLGQYAGVDSNGNPLYPLNPGFVLFRPDGGFESKRWRWKRPYRRVHEDEFHHDHIGGPETENEGQPRELWTRYPEDLPFDVTYEDPETGLPATHIAPGYTLDDRWKGPYLIPPTDGEPDDSIHYAQNDGEYAVLEPAWHTSGPHAGRETWEDGDYDPSSELGEHFDEKEDFRLLQTEGRLTDGWGRALRFFITADVQNPGETLFWIVSEGPDGEGTYPNKGICGSHSWTVDANDTMGRAYDPEDRYNKDNIVMKLSSRDWSSLLSSETGRRENMTKSLIDRIARAIVGNSPTGENTGYAGGLFEWPRLFLWESTGGDWDDMDDDDNAYTYGQPRGLWTRTPNSDAADNSAEARFGAGWRHAYITAPDKTGEGNRLIDAWGNPIHCFRDNDQFLILSAGSDGVYDFGDPADPVAILEIDDYDPTLPENLDNLVRVLDKTDWIPGFLRLPKLTILNAVGAGTVRCRLFGAFNASGARADPVWTVGVEGVVNDSDGDTTLDDWVLGDGTMGSPAFRYDDTTTASLASGARYLVCWIDTDGDSEPDAGENGLVKIFQVLVTPDGEVEEETVDASTAFSALP